MTNYEKYKDEIEKIILDGDCVALTDGEISYCMQTYCRNCKFNERGNCIPSRREWLNAEYYKEPISVVDWSKVSKDTPVMVCFTNPECEDNWFPRYWYKFVDDSTRPFMTYSDGTTSFTHKEVVSWRYAKLVRQEDIEKYSVEENT